MDDRTTETSLSLTKFGIGQPVRRSEDPKLVRGEGCYADDFNRPGQIYAVIVRSREAHGILRAISTDAAKAMPGVLGIYTAADLSAYGPLKCNMPLKSRDGSPIVTRRVPPLPATRFVMSAIRLSVSSPKRLRRQRTPPRPLRSTSIRCRSCSRPLML